MNGNMLDYRDIIKDITIEPKMSRSIQIPGFGTDEHYAYYKSDTFYSQQRKYKVQFELKSYKYWGLGDAPMALWAMGYGR